MTDRPIPFTAPMVRALLAGRKTQTRRLLPNPAYYGCPTGDCPHARQEECNEAMRDNTAPDLRFAVGDRLYVREEYYQSGSWRAVLGEKTKGGKQKWAFVPADDFIRFDAPVHFRKGRHSADPATVAWHKRLGRFMPRVASRMTLLVTDVRVEQLNDCSEADAIAEGIEQHGRFFGLPDADWDDAELSAVAAYHRLWNSINGAGAWEANPWVVAVTFTVEQRNIDA